MPLKLSNNAIGTLVSSMTDSSTSVVLAPGQGAKFPVLESGDWFPITVIRASEPTQFEIMHVTARSGDVLTVTRAREGTTAITFSVGDVVEHRLTKDALDRDFVRLGPDSLDGVRISVSDSGDDLNVIVHSNDKQTELVRRDDNRFAFPGFVVMYSGPIANIPSGWALCDGQNGTPDLRGRFIIGAGGDYAVGDTGDGSIPSHSHGAGTLATASAGSHGHSGSASSAGAHTHKYITTQAWDGSSNAKHRIGWGQNSGAATHSGQILSAGAHTHSLSINANGAHTHTISGSTAAAGSGSEVIAKYYALAYIMKL